MIRRPPRSPLFPSTTLSRSRSRQSVLSSHMQGHRLQQLLDAVPANLHADTNERSEEHTSELQSQSNLVCRLLLEKKKNKNLATHASLHYPHPRTNRVISCAL